MDLSISIVNWNTHELPDECLASVKADSPGLDVETIVVDNHSPMAVRRWCAESIPMCSSSPTMTTEVRRREQPGI